MNQTPTPPTDVIDGYDLAAEKERYAFTDVVVDGLLALNRGTATVGRLPLPGRPPALEPDGTYPADISSCGSDVTSSRATAVAGAYVMRDEGVYLDATGRVAGLVDLKTIRARGTEWGDPTKVTGRVAGGLVEKLSRCAAEAFGEAQGYIGWLTGSGNTALAGAFDLARRVAWARLRDRYGTEGLRRLRERFGRTAGGSETVPGRRAGADDPADEPQDAAFVFLAGSHMRRPAWSREEGVQVISPERLGGALVPGLLEESTAPSAGGGAEVPPTDGPVPTDLLAGLLVAGSLDSGEADHQASQWTGGLRRGQADGALVIGCELEGFCRTDAVFLLSRGGGVVPDLLAVGLGEGLGMLLARPTILAPLPVEQRPRLAAPLADRAAKGLVELETFLEVHDPLFRDRSYRENVRTKGVFLERGLRALAERHPDLIEGVRGAGVLWELDVRWRRLLVDRSWRQGLALGAKGPEDDVASIRLVLPADLLTREAEQVLAQFGSALAQVSWLVARFPESAAGSRGGSSRSATSDKGRD